MLMNEDQNPPEPDQAPDQPVPPTEKPAKPKKAKSKKKKVLLILLVLLIVAGLLAVAAFVWPGFMKDSKEAAPAATSSTAPAETKTEPKVLTPVNVVYAFSESAKNVHNLYWRPVAGGDRTQAGQLGGKSIITQSGVYEQKVFVVTETSDSTLNMWYSSDNGKSYSLIYESKDGNADALGNQITSAMFSKDGSKIIFGYLQDGLGKNTAKEIDPANKAVKDLFSIDKDGLYLKGYDSSTRTAYYYTGCYNCGGGGLDSLYSRDIANNKETTVFQENTRAVYATIFNGDYSKILVVKAASAEPGEEPAPYSVEEYTISSKATKSLVADLKDYTYAGYSSDGLTPYYSDGNNVYTVPASGAKSLVFQASKPIVGVSYVNKDLVVASSGTAADNILTSYNIATKAATTILSGDNDTRVIGVTQQ